MDDLKEKLAIQEVELQIKNDAADALIEIVGVETEKVSTEKAIGLYAKFVLFIVIDCNAINYTDIILLEL